MAARAAWARLPAQDFGALLQLQRAWGAAAAAAAGAPLAPV
jgi:hypothetical protein